MGYPVPWLQADRSLDPGIPTIVVGRLRVVQLAGHLKVISKHFGSFFFKNGAPLWITFSVSNEILNHLSTMFFWLLTKEHTSLSQ